MDYSSSEGSEEEDLVNLGAVGGIDSQRDDADILNEDCEESILWSCSDASDSDKNENIDELALASIDGEDVNINDRKSC